MVCLHGLLNKKDCIIERVVTSVLPTGNDRHELEIALDHYMQLTTNRISMPYLEPIAYIWMPCTIRKPLGYLLTLSLSTSHGPLPHRVLKFTHCNLFQLSEPCVIRDQVLLAFSSHTGKPQSLDFHETANLLPASNIIGWLDSMINIFATAAESTVPATKVVCSVHYCCLTTS